MSKQKKSSRSRPANNPVVGMTKVAAAFDGLMDEFQKFKMINSQVSNGVADCLEDLEKRVIRIEQHLKLGEIDESTEQEGEDTATNGEEASEGHSEDAT